MRTKKTSVAFVSSMLLEVAGHMTMGIAFGLGFAFVLTHIPQPGIAAYIDHSTAPQGVMLMFVLTCVTTFGMGATMTGLALSKIRE